MQRDALEAASCVVRTSTKSTVLQGCLMRVAALTTLVAGARAMSLKAGAQVPKFAVTAHTGAAVSSDSLAGSAYCLWFYPKADTGGATRRRLAVPSNRPRCIAALNSRRRRLNRGGAGVHGALRPI